MTLLGQPQSKHLQRDEYSFNPSVFNRRIGVIKGLVIGESISLFLWLRGKLGGHYACGGPHFGTPCHYQYFSNSFIFKNEIEKEGLPRDSPAGLSAGCPERQNVRLKRYKNERQKHGVYRSHVSLFITVNFRLHCIGVQAKILGDRLKR